MTKMTNQQLLLEISKDISAIKQHLKDMNGSIKQTKIDTINLTNRVMCTEKYIESDKVITRILAVLGGATVMTLVGIIMKLFFL